MAHNNLIIGAIFLLLVLKLYSTSKNSCLASQILKAYGVAGHKIQTLPENLYVVRQMKEKCKIYDIRGHRIWIPNF